MEDRAYHTAGYAQADGGQVKVGRPKDGHSVNGKLAYINDLLNRLSLEESRASTLADNLSGPVPQPPSNPSQRGETVAQMPTVVGSLDYAANILEAIVDRIRGDLNRIESALG